MSAYPLLQILFYLSMLFAPPEAKEITISGHGLDTTTLYRNAQGGWEHDQKPISIAKGHIMQPGVAGQEDTDVTKFVPATANPFWEKAPALALPESGKIQKVTDGFEFYPSAGKVTQRISRITYEPTIVAPSAAGNITVNVLGEVNKPGVYSVRADGSLLDAVAAAGGWTSQAELKAVALLHGAPGELRGLRRINLSLILKGTIRGPVLRERDTIYLEPSTF